ncbi:hypothetical protein BMS3Abin05_01054 [bacterium BMS3Abin05]|nr:hypothetical protein BMS3Abin05_01054 [bacterium BMS3Abin05]GBE28991.1 hypothetical protein BMS3Bbin03_02949 [bacterium BMS3Bbin03]
MKKGIILTFLILGISINSQAQYLNIQQHADFGKERHYFTTTLEGLGFDGWGSWFGFIDADHRSLTSHTGSSDWQFGVQFVYFELNRYFNLSKILPGKVFQNLEVTIQYNDSPASFIQPAYLAGITWDNLFPKYLYAHLEFLLRKEEQQRLAWQITGVWSKEFHLKQTLWSFQGYFDYWANDAGLWWMSEPQLLINLQPLGISKRLWMGTEWELNWSQNGSYNQINPTLFLRYDF